MKALASEMTVVDNSRGYCAGCNKEHDWAQDEYFGCVPPRNVLRFGEYVIPRAYRDALYKFAPHYNTEEVMGSYLGHNPRFPSCSDWEEEQDLAFRE